MLQGVIARRHLPDWQLSFASLNMLGVGRAIWYSNRIKSEIQWRSGSTAFDGIEKILTRTHCHYEMPSVAARFQNCIKNYSFMSSNFKKIRKLLYYSVNTACKDFKDLIYLSVMRNSRFYGGNK